MDVDELNKSYEENPSQHTESDFGKLIEPHSLPPMPNPA
jgi:hypothetical protein